MKYGTCIIYDVWSLLTFSKSWWSRCMVIRMVTLQFIIKLFLYDKKTQILMDPYKYLSQSQTNTKDFGGKVFLFFLYFIVAGKNMFHDIHFLWFTITLVDYWLFLLLILWFTIILLVIVLVIVFLFIDNDYRCK